MSRATASPLFDEVLKHQPTTELISLAAKCIAEIERRAKRESRKQKEVAQ